MSCNMLHYNLTTNQYKEVFWLAAAIFQPVCIHHNGIFCLSHLLHFVTIMICDSEQRQLSGILFCDVRFESSPTHRLFRLTFLLALFSPSGQMLECTIWPPLLLWIASKSSFITHTILEALFLILRASLIIDCHQKCDGGYIRRSCSLCRFLSFPVTWSFLLSILS